MWSEKLFEFTVWDLLGYIGLVGMTMSWALQWHASEKAKRSVLPRCFWHLRLAAAMLLLLCALSNDDLPLAIGLFASLAFYSRNIAISRAHKP